MAIAGCGSDNDCDNNNKNCVCDSNNNCVPVPPQGAAIVVHNNSGFAIKEIHVAAVGSQAWGDNLIVGTVLAPNASLTVALSCGSYDALLVDAAGEQCIVTIHLCDGTADGTADWTISSGICTTFKTQGTGAADPTAASGAAH